MAPQKDMMEFKNLDRVCLNLLAYQWMHAGPPGTMTVNEIADCFADIPKRYIHKALKALEENGFILPGDGSKSASLTRRGFDHIRRSVAEPVCANISAA